MWAFRAGLRVFDYRKVSGNEILIFVQPLFHEFGQFFSGIAIPYTKPIHPTPGIIPPYRNVTHEPPGTSLSPPNPRRSPLHLWQTNSKIALWSETTRIRWGYSIGPQQNRNSHIAMPYDFEKLAELGLKKQHKKY